MNLSEEDKDVLLCLAKQAIAARLKGGPPPVSPSRASLEVRCGAFVSLYVSGKLRGCIGTFSENEELHRVVRNMAVSAATCDTRFFPVREKELAQLEIEISVLTPRQPLNDPSEIIIGVHGIYMTCGNRRGTLLPQVAVKQHWDAYEFLCQCAENKAGIGREGWKEAELFIYEALVFRSGTVGEEC
jgi:AmmeMemoRadiSam system protein A